MSRPRIFISAVSTELGTARRLVAAALYRLGFDPISQEQFSAGHGELRRWLREQIDSCEGLIQLVGTAYGAEAPMADPEHGRVSYTQYEFLYASRRHKRSWFIVIGDDYPRDSATEDQIEALGGPQERPAEALQSERRALQTSYVARLKSENHVRYTVNTPTELENVILRLPDGLGELRHKTAKHERRVSVGLAAILAAVLLLSLVGWFTTQRIQRSVQESAAVTTARIRGHLLEAVDERRRLELLEAEQATDPQESQRLREAADRAHAARLVQIDQLASSFSEIEGQGDATNILKEMTRILRDQGLEQALGYIEGQRPSILSAVRARAAAERERNRTALRPLLQAAQLLATKGKSAEAKKQFDEILGLEPDWQLALYQALTFLTDQGDAALSHGALSLAEEHFKEVQRMIEHLIALAPSTPEWQNNLSSIYTRQGDLLEAQGDALGALAAHRKSLALAEDLTQRDSTNATWQRNVAIGHNRVGDLLLRQGDKKSALAAYRNDLAITESLATRDPSNGSLQLDLSISHNRIGGLLSAQGKRPEALAAYRRSLAILERLISTDPAKMEWQHHLSSAYAEVGTALTEMSDWTAAREAYIKSVTIGEAVVKSDPDNTDWQATLASVYEQVGVMFNAQGDLIGAFEVFDMSLAIYEKLVARDETNALWQANLAYSYYLRAWQHESKRERKEAIAATQRSLAIYERLLSRYPTNAGWKKAAEERRAHIAKLRK